MRPRRKPRRLSALFGGLLLTCACSGGSGGSPVPADSLPSTLVVAGVTTPESTAAATPDLTLSADLSPTAAASSAPITSDPPGSTTAATLEPTSSSTSEPTRSSTSEPTTSGFPAVGVSGVNDPGCRSDARPVLLLHGTFSTTASNFTALIPALIASGRCVYALDYGNAGIGRVTDSADAVAAFVGRIRAATGVDQIDVIGYSQGGLVLRTALRLDGLANRVGTAVLIAPSFHGTTSSLVANLPAGVCPACSDQAAGSALLRQLDQGGDLDGRVRYAVVSTRRDTVVTPVSSQLPEGPSDRVRSIVVEDQCPTIVTDHVSLPAVPGVIHWAVAALASDGRPPPGALTC